MANRPLKHIACTLEDNVAHVEFRFEGARDFDEWETLVDELLSVAQVEGVQAILINFSVMEYVTSRILNGLVSLHHLLQKDGRALALCRLRGETLRVVKLSRLNALIPVYDTEDEALEALRSGGEG